MIAQDELIEYARYVNNYYGTPKAYVEEQLAAGKDVILEIEIQSASNSFVFIDEQVVYFANAKAKELLALCADHRGGNVTMEEAIDKLWGERLYDERVKTLYRKAVMYLKKLFQVYEVEDVFVNNRGSCNIHYEKVDCDYYAVLEGRTDTMREKQYVGQYLWEYSWAEETAIELEEKIK